MGCAAQVQAAQVLPAHHLEHGPPYCGEGEGAGAEAAQSGPQELLGNLLGELTRFIRNPEERRPQENCRDNSNQVNQQLWQALTEFNKLEHEIDLLEREGESCITIYIQP